MPNRSFAWIPACLLLIVLVFCAHTASADTGKAVAPELPKDFDARKIDSFLAQLTDEQVRRMLIEELRKEASAGEMAAAPKEDIGDLAGLIEHIKQKIIFVRERVDFLLSGARATPKDFPLAFRNLAEGGKAINFLQVLKSLLIIFMVSLIIDRLFRKYSTRARRAIEELEKVTWKIKMGRLAINSLIDFASIALFLITTLILILVLTTNGSPQRLLALVYVTAFLIVKTVQPLSRFILAPHAPTLRYLPLEDGTARHLHKWTMRISTVGAFGWLTCGLLRLNHISVALHLLMVAMVGLVITGMLITVIFQNRERMSRSIRKDLPEFNLRPKIASIWHRLAAGYVLILWSVWAVALMLEGTRAVLPAIAAIISIPLFFLIDWALQSLLNLTIGAIPSIPSGTAPTPAEEPTDGTLPQIPAPDKTPGGLDFNRLNRVLRRSLRLLTAAFVLFWMLDIWGIEVSVGKAVVRVAFSSLIAVLLCYVVYEMFNIPIQRKLREEMPEEDEDAEEGGVGGSRIGTLLLLLRKFILTVLVVIVVLIILSSMGINIGPLIAGAGVVGLALGFGAQTLVRDIISGVFFLIDDAFRVGDYVDTGKVKGTVEQITLRSLRLRHHRGMLNTIPFGDIGSVTNFSRDYIIMKLDIRARYDTDIDKVRKIIKKINKRIMKDPELAPKLLDKIKSQGVKAMDDSAMIMRIKFKTVPGA